MHQGDLLHGRTDGQRLSRHGASRPRRGTRSRIGPTHPFTFSRMSVPQAAAQIEGGFASIRAALGDPDAVAPFFRIPGLLRQDSVEQYLAAHGVMTWSVDVVADDWTHINAAEIARRAVSRLEARGKGVLLLHDMHEKTAVALPVILQELKARGLQDRSRRAGGTGPAEDRDHARAMGGARGARARTLAARGRHRYGVVRAGIDGAEPGELRRRRSSRGPAVTLSLAPGFDHMPLQPGEVSHRRSHRRRAQSIRRRRRARSRFLRRRSFQYSRVFAGPRRDTLAARRANGWRLRRQMVSGRRRPIGQRRASRPRSGDLAPRRHRGCSVTSCRACAHAAIARPVWPWR